MLACRSMEKIRSKIITYLFKPWKTNGLHEKYGFITVLKMLYPEVVRKIRSRECPFCGRKFKQFSGIMLHLTCKRSNGKGGFCYFEFLNMLHHVMDVYYEAKYVVEIEKCGSRKKLGTYRITDHATGERHYFKTLAEAVGFYVNNYVKVG